MKPYAVRFTKEAVKDVQKVVFSTATKAREILAADLATDPFSGKKLVGDLTGFYSIRLSRKDRIVFSVDEATRTIFIHRARTHYGE